MGSLRAFMGRAVRAARIVVVDEAIPRPLRWLVAVGLLPVPGPLDEAVLLLAGGVMWVFYRGRIADAWRRAGR